MNLYPKISIIIPTYNRYELVKRAIESVLTQNYPNIECVVIDDCSTDGSYEKINQLYGQRIILLHNDQNLEKSKSRNLGILKATGEFLGFLDSDDIYLPDSLQQRLNPFLADPAFNGVVFGQRIHADGHQYTFIEKKRAGDQLSLTEYLNEHRWLTGNAILMRRSLMIEKGLYNESLTNREDVELFIRLLSAQIEFRCLGIPVTQIYNDATVRARSNLKKILIQGTKFSDALMENPLTVSMVGVEKIREMREKEIHNILSSLYHFYHYQQYRDYLSQEISLGRFVPDARSIRRKWLSYFFQLWRNPQD